MDVPYTDSAGTAITEDWGTDGTSVATGGSKNIEGVDSNSDGTEDIGVQADSTIRVLWQSAEGGTSSQINSYEGPA